MAAQSGERALEIERVLPASPAVVFAAFSAPDQLAGWWGPEGFEVPGLDFDPRAGEAYRIEMQPPEGDAFHLAGEFREVDPPVRLAFTFAWEEPDPDDLENLVELSFHDLGGSTEVLMTQRPFKTEERQELHLNGWSDSFDKLERTLLVRRVVDAWNRRDLDELVALSDSEIEYVNSPGAVEPGTRRGYDGLAAVLQAQWETLLDGRQEIDRIHHHGDEVVTSGRLSRRMPDSEARVEEPLLTAWKVRDGKIARCQILGFGVAEVREALEAAGLTDVR